MRSPREAEHLEPAAARELALSLGLLAREYDAVTDAIGRTPTRTELVVFAGMWSEHCSYKSTLHWLRELPTEGPRILAGPGAHAGVVEVSDDWAVAFKVESHNHPSAVEPYQGAATGVGGILRDIIAQGARPCAVMDSLCFDTYGTRQTRHLADGVVDGIAGYGNAFGVPNVGGRVVYDGRYGDNILVNALAAGLVRKNEMRTANARGVGNVILYVGAVTGRDGILGAAFASEELAEDKAEERSHVQVGDPFTGKKLMEACLSFTPEMGMIACQDMGACGITCAMVEMAAAGGVGIEIDLDTVPLREADMTPQEIMLSESQERFLFVVEADRAEAAAQHFETLGCHTALCGRIVEGNRAVALYKGEVVVDVPAALVADGTPPSNWPVAEALPAVAPYPDFAAPRDLGAQLLALLSAPNLATKRPVYRRYDQTVGNRTVCGPEAAEAAVLKLPATSRGFALTITSRGDLCAADPYLGAKATLAEACRDLACAGAEMVAITDGINIGSPQDPVENKKLEQIIRGLGDGLGELDVPVTGGNCSLYNESKRGAIPPTPMVGALGLVADVTGVPAGGVAPDQVVFLLGELSEEPRVSEYGRLRTGADGGAPAAVDLAAERRLADFLVTQAGDKTLRATKALTRGGFAVALAKLALRGGVGLRVSLSGEAARPDWRLFGEPAACALVAVDPARADSFNTAARDAGLPVARIGETGGDRLTIDAGGHPPIDLDLGTLRAAYDSPEPPRGAV